MDSLGSESKGGEKGDQNELPSLIAQSRRQIKCYLQWCRKGNEAMSTLDCLFGKRDKFENQGGWRGYSMGFRRISVKLGVFKGFLAVFLLLFLVQTAVAQGAWIPTGSMSTSRAEFTLTRLCDGRVLAAGGSGPSITFDCKRFN